MGDAAAVELDPLRLLAEQDGFFTRAQADAAGYSDRDVAACRRQRVWHSFRRGCYTFRDRWEAENEEGRHLIRARAVLRSLGPAVALSHVSAALAHGVSVVGVDLSRVHVTRLDGASGRTEGDVVHHQGICLEGDLVEVDGMCSVTAVRAVLEAGARLDGGPRLVLADSGLHLQLFDHDQLMRCFETMQHWPFMRCQHITVRMADGRSASPGESLGRYLFWTGGVPAPQLQFPVHDAEGRLLGTTDWGWPEHGALGEFDGRVKYGRLLRTGMQPGDVVFAEKQREDLLRETTGYRMVRLVWEDYQRPQLTLARVRRALGLDS